MPTLSHSSFIKGTAARYNGIRGNLLLSAEGLWFVPDDGGTEVHIPIEKIMDASLEGVVRKKVCVVVNGSNERHLFSVSDYELWRSSISLAAGIYRRIITGSVGTAPAPSSNPAAPNAPAPKQQSKSPSKAPSQPKTTTSRKKKAPSAAPAPQQAQVTQQTAAPKPAASASATVPPTTPAPSRTAVSGAYSGPWPSGQDYEQSFQMMKLSLSPKVGNLAKWEPVKNPKTPGWYVYASGNYGSIYKIKDEGDKFFALKCFTRKSGNLNERYLRISDYLSSKGNGINFLAHFRYYEEGIKTRKSQNYFFPVLKMEWIDGVTLNKFIQSNIGNPKILRKISLNLMSEIQKLQNAGISHGDLAGDNIIVTSGGEVKLVDYDGMFIPDFKGKKSSEMGHADFQHPGRTADSFSSRLDNFAALIIHLSLSAIAEKPELWDKYNGSDPDCLIIRKKDFLNLSVSQVFKDLKGMRNKKVKKMCSFLEDYLSHGPLWDGANPGVLTSL